MAVVVEHAVHLESNLAIVKGVQKAMLSNVGFIENILNNAEGDIDVIIYTNKDRHGHSTRDSAE